MLILSDPQIILKMLSHTNINRDRIELNFNEELLLLSNVSFTLFHIYLILLLSIVAVHLNHCFLGLLVVKFAVSGCDT